MNVEQALNAADEGKKEGLCGLYPMAAQVLAAELRMMRENSDTDRRDRCSICHGTGKVSDGYEDFTCPHCEPEYDV